MKKCVINKLGLAVAAAIGLGTGSSAWGWNPPKGSDTFSACEQLTCLPFSVDPAKTVTHADTSYSYPDHFNENAHGYIIEHAIQLLENEGYENWAAAAHFYHQRLMDGARWADTGAGRLRASVYQSTCFGFDSHEVMSQDVAPLAAFNHYHDPNTGAGIDLSGLDLLDTLGDVKGGGAVAIYWVLEVASKFLLNCGDPELRLSNDIAVHWRSAASLADEYFTDATNSCPGGFFKLGAAAHLIADMAMVDHTYHSWLGNHGAYENAADNLGATAGYHADYGVELHPSWSAYDYAQEVARQTHTPDQFDMVEGNALDFNAALKMAIPRAERYTAGLMASYLDHCNVPSNAPSSLDIRILSDDGSALPGAHLFFRQEGVDRDWGLTQADENGKVSLPYYPGTFYALRPAMPGYDFDGTLEHLEAWEAKRTPFIVEADPVAWIPGTPAYTFILKRRLSEVSLADGGDTSAAAPQLSTSFAVESSVGGNPIVGETRDMPPEEAIRVAEEPPSYSDIESSHLSLSSEQAEVKLATTSEIYNGYQVADENLAMLAQIEADKVQRQYLLEVTPDQAVLGVQGGGHSLATYTIVSMALYRPVEAQSGLPITSTMALEDQVAGSLLELSETGISAAQALQNETLAPATEGFIQEVVEDNGSHLPIADATDEMLEYGIIALPALTGTRVSVEIVPSRNFLGDYTAAPFVVETDAAGKAKFRITAGSHAGKLLVRVQVLDTPDGSEILPSTELEIPVYPAASGPDPVDLVHPKVELANPTVSETLDSTPVSSLTPNIDQVDTVPSELASLW